MSMILCYVDASAWSKRYTGEIGWEVLDVLLDEVALGGHALLISSAISHAETYSALVRFRNRTTLPDDKFDQAINRITADQDKLFWLPVAEAVFRSCSPLILKHNINATDAALLRVLLGLRDEVQTMGHRVWLVASDKRLLRAATIEGLPCLDPEVSSPREVRQLFISE